MWHSKPPAHRGSTTLSFDGFESCLVVRGGPDEPHILRACPVLSLAPVSCSFVLKDFCLEVWTRRCGRFVLWEEIRRSSTMPRAPICLMRMEINTSTSLVRGAR